MQGTAYFCVMSLDAYSSINREGQAGQIMGQRAGAAVGRPALCSIAGPVQTCVRVCPGRVVRGY